MIDRQDIANRHSYQFYPMLEFESVTTDDDTNPGLYYPGIDLLEFRVKDEIIHSLPEDEFPLHAVDDELQRIINHEIGHIHLSKRTPFWDQHFLYSAAIAFDVTESFGLSAFLDLIEDDPEGVDEVVIATGRLHRHQQLELDIWRPMQESYAFVEQAYNGDYGDITDRISFLKAQVAAWLSNGVGLDFEPTLAIDKLMNLSNEEKELIQHLYVYEVLDNVQTIFDAFGSEYEYEALLTIRRLARIASYPGSSISDWAERGPVQFIETIRALADVSGSLPQIRDENRSVESEKIATYITELLGFPASTPDQEAEDRTTYLDAAISNTIGALSGQGDILRNNVLQIYQAVTSNLRPTTIVFRAKDSRERRRWYHQDRSHVVRHQIDSALTWLLFSSIRDQTNYLDDESITTDFLNELKSFNRTDEFENMQDYLQTIIKVGRVEEISNSIWEERDVDVLR